MTDQTTPCRTTRHCVDHGFCHRCTPSLDDTVRHLVKAIGAAGIDDEHKGAVYTQLAATVRGAARTASGQQPKPPVAYSDGQGRVYCQRCANTVEAADVPLTVDHVDHWELCPNCGRHVIDVAREAPTTGKPDPVVVDEFISDMATQSDPTTADDPTPLRWGLGDVLWGDDDTVIVCLSGPAPDRAPYWLELDAECAAALRDDLAVGQPAEAQAADEARPPREQWRVEGYDADEWNPVSRTFSSSQDAHARKRVSQRYPDMPTRVVRETTTWTVEDETR